MHVVIADSGGTMLRIIARQLCESGETVTLFTDGRDALEYIRSEPSVDVLLAGFELESMSGTELCWEVQIDPAGAIPVYVIVMSCSSQKTKLIEALDSGADDFLHKPFSAEELRARLRAAARVRQSHLRLIELAASDPLTGVSNRRSFFEQAEKCLSGAPCGQAIAALMLDIDHFKGVNDTYGHDAGDDVLRAVTAAVKEFAPIFGRLGGEEFAAIFPDTSLSDALGIAEKMRNAVSALSFQAGAETFSVTCSIGLSERFDGQDIDTVLKNADLALYEAKETGRNKTVSFDPSRSAESASAAGEGPAGKRFRKARRQDKTDSGAHGAEWAAAAVYKPTQA